MFLLLRRIARDAYHMRNTSTEPYTMTTNRKRTPLLAYSGPAVHALILFVATVELMVHAHSQTHLHTPTRLTRRCPSPIDVQRYAQRARNLGLPRGDGLHLRRRLVRTCVHTIRRPCCWLRLLVLGRRVSSSLSALVFTHSRAAGPDTTVSSE